MTLQAPQHSSTNPSPEPAPPRRRWTQTRIALLSVGLIILLAMGAIGWWLISPLFLFNTGRAENPFTSTPTANQTTTTSPNTPTPAQPTVPNEPKVLATGTLVDINDGIHHGSGNVSIGETGTGKYVLHFDQFKVTNGPDLYVYLSPHADPTTPGQVTEGGVNLGRLNETEGAVNIDIPEQEAMHLQEYKSVVIYCQAFAVIFTKAPLQFQ